MYNDELPRRSADLKIGHHQSLIADEAAEAVTIMG